MGKCFQIHYCVFLLDRGRIQDVKGFGTEEFCCFTQVRLTYEDHHSSILFLSVGDVKNENTIAKRILNYLE